MKKKIVKILSCIVCLCLLVSTLFACAGTGSWKATNMKGWGEVKAQSLGGFTAETDKYIYFVAGSTASSSDNTFGKPTKGSLMVADKTDLSKTDIAVPKLFGATDYKAGLYIFGDYVYYGSPSTDKTPDGTIANTEMMFRRAKLDGSSDEHLLSVGSLAYEYRIVKGADNAVYIVYYDSASSSLKSFNTSNKQELVIAKTDEKTAGNQSLSKYKFLANEMTGGAVVVYTTTEYSESYNEDMNEGTSSTRPTESYNKVYAYKVGDQKQAEQEVVGKLIFDGSKQLDSTYNIVSNDKNYLYIERTNAFSAVKTFAININDIATANGESDIGVEVVADYINATNYVESLDKVYILDKTDTANVKLYVDKLKKADLSADNRELVAKCNTINSLLFTHGDYIYYYNSNNNLCRLSLTAKEDAKEERVSEDSVLTAWYKPEIITIGEKEYIFYCDNSSMGNSNVKYVDLSNVAVGEDTNNDKEDDLFYLEGQMFLGKVSDSDYAKFMDVKIGNLSKGLTDGGLLDFDTDANGAYELDNGKLQVGLVKEMRAEYNDLSSSIKEKMSADSIKTLEKYERAIEIANMFYKLDGIKEVEDKDSPNFDDFKAKYLEIKSQIDEYYASEEYKTIGNYIDVNLKANYSKAQSLFEEKNK